MDGKGLPRGTPTARPSGRWRRVVLLVAIFLLGVGCAGFGVFFAQQGLQRADQLSSVIGMFVGLAGLGVAGYSAWLARVAVPTPPSLPNASGLAAPATKVPGSVGGPSVSGSVIGGDNTQISAGGDVRIDGD
jgi:hypothetical protein